MYIDFIVVGRVFNGVSYKICKYLADPFFICQDNAFPVRRYHDPVTAACALQVPPIYFLTRKPE
jgi:hypothetical protein